MVPVPERFIDLHARADAGAGADTRPPVGGTNGGLAAGHERAHPRVAMPTRRFLVTFLALAAATLLSAAPAAAIPADWTAASRALATHAVVSPDIAVQLDGTPHIATDGGPTPGIWYLTRIGTTWEQTQVTTG